MARLVARRYNILFFVPVGSVDLIERFSLHDLAESNSGVEKVSGLCPQRVISEGDSDAGFVEDPAYRITDEDYIDPKNFDEVFRSK